MLGAVGASMVAASLYGMFRNTPKSDLKRVVSRTLVSMKLDNVKVEAVDRIEGGWEVHFKLPAGYTTQEFEKEAKVALEEVSYAGDATFHKLQGNRVSMRFGYATFSSSMPFLVHNRPRESLKVPLFSPFGTKYLNFNDETCCHLLIGGTTRMGKSVFIRLIITLLMLGTDGKISIYVFDNKINDLHPFKSIPQIRMAETVQEANGVMTKIMVELDRRKSLLKSKGDVVDAKDYRAKYPEEAMEPIFIIVDEYARFADNDPFQENIMMIAETAGYLDVHLIVASQRPDVQTVLKPRIRANLLTRVCFTTTDEANSKLIIETPDAAHLGRIQGRAILMDGFPSKVQVPYLSADTAKKLLQPYTSEEIRNEQPRQTDRHVPEALQNLIQRPLGPIGGIGECEPSGDHQPDSKATGKGRGRSSSSTAKR